MNEEMLTYHLKPTRTGWSGNLSIDGKPDSLVTCSGKRSADVCRRLRQKLEAKLAAQAVLTYHANANGYMLYYKGEPLGGASIKLPRSRPLRGNQAQANRREFSEQARSEIAQLQAGGGQARFREIMAAIDASSNGGVS